MRSNFFRKGDFFITLIVGSVLVVLVIILGISFFNAIFETQLNSRKEFLGKQTELAARGLELEIRRFEEESKDLVNYLEDPGHELDDYDEEFTSAARRMFNSFPNLIDSVWVDMIDSVLIFNMNERNDFFRTRSSQEFPDSQTKPYSNLRLGKKGFRALYSLDLVSFTKEYVTNFYLSPGGGKYLIFNAELVDLNPSGNTKIKLSEEELSKVIGDVALGLKGLYPIEWDVEGEEISGILAQYPFSFVLSNHSGSLVFLSATESLTTGIYSTYLFFFVGFVFLLVGTVVFFFVSLKNNLEFQRFQEENYLEISALFRQQNLLLQELRGFVFFYDYQGHITRVSDEVESILGLSKEQFIQIFLDESDHPEVLIIKKNVMEALAENKDILDMEYDYVRPEGTKLRLRIFEKLVFDESGRFTGGIGICTDITQQFESNTKLVNSENRLRTLINNIPDIIYIYDSDGRVIDYHIPDGVQVLPGSQLWKGEYLEDLVEIEEKTKVLESFKLAQATGKIQTVQVHVNLPSGIKHYETRFFPLDSEHIVSISKDITGQKIWEKGLVDAMQAADQANRAKSEFLANMSHEIRTPMNGLLGIIDLLEQTNLNKVQKQYVGIIKNSGNTLLSIIRDILDYSKIEVGKIEVVNEVFAPGDELEKQAQILLGLAKKKNIKFSFSKGENASVQIESDKVKINQIFLNLVGNAIKFTPENGIVEVSLELEPVHDELYSLNCKVKDTGIGISKEHLDHLTDPFFQIESSNTRTYQGTGLGLAIAKKMIELLGGELFISSEPGIGSEFSFSLLVKKASEESVSLPKEVTSWKQIRENGSVIPFRLLLAEDNDLNLQLMELMLDQLGFDYGIARNGKEALDKVKETDFDLILMDVQMPIMNGFEAAEEIRKIKGKDDVVIIGLSANVFEEDQRKALDSGMDDYLTKPIRLAVLADKLDYYRKIIQSKKIKE
ncbi:PAS domain-containing hybrid sensor histidine kinase/response regulator [Algoriphagus sp. CAU 1675]|uniref:PAS domain-containing hybrid sensor histidine kinase/response regulator n=1 Tax=Algoriphagus sp. CAU 1675 TaxID=3032597 RepID=UPI0023DC111A|nr:PAS domain-containing hybrid sensor histidine kinase/response regulator [Algoriphagus sp. CAU 1675]MDF2158074.1 ATP-binding protein [Algoriphagus sp. CAU 1675]